MNFVEAKFDGKDLKVPSLENIKNQNISKIIEESKSQLTQDNLSDKAKYILSHKVDTLLKINQ